MLRKDGQKLSAFNKLKYCSRQCSLIVARAIQEEQLMLARVASLLVQPAESYLPFAQQQADRFWSRVDKSGGDDACWPWTRGKDKDGYGKFAVTLPMSAGSEKQAHVRAHRLALELHLGELLGARLATHSCDAPACCNPKHLSPGTPLSNMREKISRGRARYKKAA
jgi:hypothetical protein